MTSMSSLGLGKARINLTRLAIAKIYHLYHFQNYPSKRSASFSYDTGRAPGMLAIECRVVQTSQFSLRRVLFKQQPPLTPYVYYYLFLRVIKHKYTYTHTKHSQYFIDVFKHQIEPQKQNNTNIWFIVQRRSFKNGSLIAYSSAHSNEQSKQPVSSGAHANPPSQPSHRSVK